MVCGFKLTLFMPTVSSANTAKILQYTGTTHAYTAITIF